MELLFVHICHGLIESCWVCLPLNGLGSNFRARSRLKERVSALLCNKRFKPLWLLQEGYSVEHILHIHSMVVNIWYIWWPFDKNNPFLWCKIFLLSFFIRPLYIWKACCLMISLEMKQLEVTFLREIWIPAVPLNLPLLSL